VFTLTDLHGDIYTAIAEASGADVAALQAADNSANIRSTVDNLTVWINEAGELLARRCVALRGRRRAALLPGHQSVLWVVDGVYPELVEFPVGRPSVAAALGRPWAAFHVSRSEALYMDAAQTPLESLVPSRLDVLERWRSSVSTGSVLDVVLPSVRYWANMGEQGVFFAPPVGRVNHLVLDTLNLPIPLVEASDSWAWLPVGGRRLLTCYGAARVCEVRREDETLYSRAPHFWAEFWGGVKRLWLDLPTDVRGLYPLPEAVSNK
jgi:hypothetical protein